MEATISEQPEANQGEQVPEAETEEEAPGVATPLVEPPNPGSQEPTRSEPTEGAAERPQEAPEIEQAPASPTVASPPQTDPSISQLIIQPLESPFAQMEAYLVNQLDKATHYKNLFFEQGNLTLSSHFDTYHTLTQKDLELLRQVWKEKSRLPKFKFEAVRITATPTNIDIKDKELRIVVRTMNLPVAQNAVTYVIGEFEYPLTGKGETMTQSVARWAHSVKIEPRNMFCCCTGRATRQLDQVTSTTIKPFFNKESGMTEYERALEFFVERGKSRTLKRKFKPVKLIFYEKTGILKCDKKLGTVQVRIDCINDEASLIMRLPVMNGRRQTDAMADVRVQVRQPLVDKSSKTHEEKFLILT